MMHAPGCPASSSSHALSWRSSTGNIVAFRPQSSSVAAYRGLRQLKVECAINRATKEKRVAELTDLLERSDVAFAVRYNKISVKNLESFRRSLPADAKLCVAKNTLMKVAVSQVNGWEPLVDEMKLENAWVFASDDSIPAAVKAFLDFEKALLEPFPKPERIKLKITDISAGCMGGNKLDAAAVRKLEKLPTKTQMIGSVAIMVKKVPTRVAVAIKQVPVKLAYGIKALADGDENKDILVGDVFPRAAAPPS